jgi:hypothetical protein
MLSAKTQPILDIGSTAGKSPATFTGDDQFRPVYSFNFCPRCSGDGADHRAPLVQNDTRSTKR